MWKWLLLLALLLPTPVVAQTVVAPCSGAGRSCVPTNNAAPLVVGANSGPVYSYTATITPAAAPTDVLLDCGSASKTVVVDSVFVSATAGANGTMEVFFTVRSTADTGGTSSAVGGVASDSLAQAPTASVLAYTANPTLGTTVGSVFATPLEFTTGGALNVPVDARFTHRGAPQILRGTGNCLAVNLGGGSLPTGGVVYVTVVQSEQ